MEDGEVASYTAVEQQPHVPPGNDNCAAARPISSDTFFDVLDTTAATVRATASRHLPVRPGGVSRSVWYSFTPDQHGHHQRQHRRQRLRHGAGGLERLPAADPSSPALTMYGSRSRCWRVPVTAGTTYFIQVAATGNPAADQHVASRRSFPWSLGSPPTISKLVLGTPEVSSPLCNAGSGTAFPLRFDYIDQGGNVKRRLRLRPGADAFEPSQREETDAHRIAPTITGDGFTGTVSFGACGTLRHRYGDLLEGEPAQRSEGSATSWWARSPTPWGELGVVASDPGYGAARGAR